MSVSGLCEICGNALVEDGCDRCGRLVCIDHHDESTGLCPECLAEFGQERSDDTGARPDGVDEYRF